MPRGEQVAEKAFFGNPGSRLAFAHRGGSALWPENTRAAFEGALALGCSHLETDVRMTSDGEIVLMHDAGVARTTEGQGLVSDLSWQQLRKLDAGYQFESLDSELSERGHGHRVMKFSELVELAPEAFFNVEIKEWGPEGQDLPEAFWQFIVAHKLQKRILVAAEQHDLIVRFRQLSKGQIPTAASRRECLWFWAMSRAGLASLRRWPFQALQIPTYASGLRVVRPQLLQAAQACGVAVHVWTIDEFEQMSELLELGVDGLMSDRPDRLMKLLPQ